MPTWLNTRGRSTLGVGLCDRCHFKYSLDDLQPDGNTPGLRVCRRCCDEFDPYRLPARQPDDLTLPFYRPQEQLIVPDEPQFNLSISYSEGPLAITLTWSEGATPPGASRTGYQIHRSVDSGEFELLASAGPEVFSYVDYAVSAGQVLSYYIAETFLFSAPVLSAEESITVPGTPGPALLDHDIVITGYTGTGAQEPRMLTSLWARPGQTFGDLLIANVSSGGPANGIIVDGAEGAYTGSVEWWNAPGAPPETYQVRFTRTSGAIFDTQPTAAWVTLNNTNNWWNFGSALFTPGNLAAIWLVEIRDATLAVVASANWNITVTAV